MKVLATLALCFWITLSAQAAPKKSAQKSKEDARARAGELFAQSKAYYNIHEYQKALEGFKEAYLLSQEPVLILNMGQCYRYMGQYQDAIVSYQTFLQESPNSPYQENVEKLIVEMQEKLAALSAPEPVVTPQPASAPASPQLPPALSDEPYRAPTLLYGATAAAFVFGLGSGGLAVALSRKEDDIILENNNDPAALADALAENETKQKSATGLAIGLAVTGVASAVTGYLLFRNHKQNKKEIAPMEALLEPSASLP